MCSGIDNGAMLKIPGMGGPVPRQFGGAGEPGDLLLQVEVEPSPIFQRDGNDVSVPRTIDFVDAILGRDLRCVPGWPSLGESRGNEQINSRGAEDFIGGALRRWTSSKAICGIFRG